MCTVIKPNPILILAIRKHGARMIIMKREIRRVRERGEVRGRDR